MTSAARAVLAAVFGTAARIRRGRPLHPVGLLFDAALHLHGAPSLWGAAFLDEAMELRGIARLSRSAGLPYPSPDVLGLAVRWPHPSPDGTAAAEDRAGAEGTGRGATAASDAEAAPGATAELLLATTGRTVPGRRLLRPAVRWAPGLYGSLLPYGAGGDRVLLGAVARRSWASPARLGALARVAAARPLVFDLVVASPTGPWERFGVLELTGPAHTDADEPVRFDPLRHPIPGLEPAGWIQRVREGAYAAAQRVPDAEAAGLSGRRARSV
ncbi:hypothetical protein ACWDTT_32950 [Streptosporangium sandarakinum]|uniref:hypothetical protein n=1 Tax=Streptosporangium TaxID=2000 RepID=UPI0031FA39F8